VLVDDEPNIREFVRRSLEKHAFKVKLATNGWEALVEFEQTIFVLVILDIMMPQMNPGKIFTHETLLRRVWGTDHSRDCEFILGDCDAK